MLGPVSEKPQLGWSAYDEAEMSWLAVVIVTTGSYGLAVSAQEPPTALVTVKDGAVVSVKMAAGAAQAPAEAPQDRSARGRFVRSLGKKTSGGSGQGTTAKQPCKPPAVLEDAYCVTKSGAGDPRIQWTPCFRDL